MDKVTRNPARGRGVARAARLWAVCAVFVALLVAFTTTVPIWVTPAAASEGSDTGELEKVRLLDESWPSLLTDPAGTRDTAANGLWTWPEARRGYTLTAPVFVSTSTQESSRRLGLATVSAFDLGTGEMTGSVDFPSDKPAWAGGSTTGNTYLMGDHQAAMDTAGGRMFMPYVTGSGAPLVQRCMTTPHLVGNTSMGCVAGVHVVDLRTMAVTGSIPVNVVRVEGGAVYPALRAISFAPARHADESDKVLLLVEEVIAHGSQTQPSPQHSMAVNLTYLVQLDIDSGRQDWVVRLDGCRGNHDYAPGFPVWGARHPATVFRAPDVSSAAIYVGCHNGTKQVGTVVRLPLDEQGNPAGLPVTLMSPDAVTDNAIEQGPDWRPQPAEIAAPAPAAQVFPGPERTWEWRADPLSERLMLRVVDGKPSAEVWWVFDGKQGAFIGTIGIGEVQGHSFDWIKSGSNAFDPVTGRLYVLQHRAGNQPGGLYLTDIRRTPLAQALSYPHILPGGTDSVNQAPMAVDSPAPGGGARIIFIPWRTKGAYSSTRVIEDREPVFTETVEQDFAGRTQDLEEMDGVTQISADGAARGYGARVLLIGGAEAFQRAGPVDVLGTTRGVYQDANQPDSIVRAVPDVPDAADPCADADRDVVVGFIGPGGPAVLDSAGARGSAVPLAVDSGTRGDTEAVASRCLKSDWDAIWATALFGRAPVEEPGVPWLFDQGPAQCVSGSGTPVGQTGDSVTGSFAAQVDCGGDEVSGYSYARGVQVSDLAVAEALSSFRVYRDPGRGIVSRVESVARGISLDPLVRIGTVRGTAESWANGRRQQVAAADRPAEYDPNCDLERTAGTCFQRHLFGVRTPAYSCGPCGDEARAIDAISRAMGANARVTLRQPDPRLARGAENGFTAAIQKPELERFGDLVLNNDLLQTVIPVLEIVRYANAARQVISTNTTPPGRKGRQIYQFAGVEVSSSYAIQCLLVYDEVANTCAAPAEAPGSITVSLSDPEGQSLAGGAFEVREDVDADGVLGLADTLLPDGACMTAEDGIGTCLFENLAPGTYLVNQVAAPPGYAKSAEPWVSEVASGEQRTVAFTNVSNVSTIDMTVTDENGAPLLGASFAAYPDPDADGKVAPDAQPAATCTTDGQGVCSMQVPAGSYVLVQTGAPGGLEGIEPVAFTFASGGQVAAVTVVNYPPSQPAAPEGSASPEIAYTAPVGYSPPVESIDDSYVPADSVGEPATAGPSVPEQIGGTVVRVIRAPGDALRLFARDPQQAVAFTAALALLVLALLAVRRRQLLGDLTAVPAFAFTGGGTPPPPAPPRPPGPSAGPGPSGGSSGGPGGSGGSSGNDGPGRPAGDAPAAFSDQPQSSSPSMHAATAVLERPPFVAGAAPSALERASARIVVATGHPVLAALATQRLVDAPSCAVVAVADSLEALRGAVADHAPDVVVVDLAMPTGSDEDVCDILGSLHPAGRTVGLIPPNRAIEALVTRGHAAGLGGLLAADEDLTNGQLGYAVRCVSVGKTFFGPAVQAVLLRKFPAPPRPKKPAALLTPRQLEVARLAASGLKRSDIAKRLFLSPATVKLHLSVARKRLGVTDPWDNTQLRKRLNEAGLLDAPDHQSEQE